MAPHAVDVEDYDHSPQVAPINDSDLPSRAPHVQEITPGQLSSHYFPAAIVGLACRFPGGVSNPEQLWEMCTRSRDGWSTVPKERFNIDAYAHPDASKLGHTNATGGYFIKDDPWVFDAPFFNITAAEAKAMDPQQRILLEMTFEALENAGLPKEQLIGEKVGVFMASTFNDYDAHSLRDTDTVPMYSATGYNPCMLANRVSYYFDFRGPSYTCDTACSSSLTSLYNAMNALRNGDCKYAIVGGANVNITPDRFIDMSLSQLYNDEGKCYAFDHRAVGGYARGEGTGVIVLRPLEDAKKNNDYIRCSIVNAMANQDGRTNGITAPNGDAQYDLIKYAYSSAGILPSDCGYVEMHGTGTKKGDPIEARAVARAFAKGRSHRDPLHIGSIKANIGHLEGISGMASLIKTALVLDKKLILPNVNWEKANPEIPMDELNITVPTETAVWPRGKRFASINGFGFGGGNAHAILERVPPLHDINYEGVFTEAIKWRLFTITANDQDALTTNARKLLTYFDEYPEAFDARQSRNLAYTYGQRRSHLPWKLSVPFTSIESLYEQLAVAKLKPVRATKAPRLGWIFTGQGAQWYAMGRELIDIYPVFRDSMTASDKLLKKLGAEFSLIEQLHDTSEEDSLANEAFFSQPGCVALQVALVDLLHSWNVYATDVAGHSSGEISAAYAAGIITAEDAVTLGYYRGEGAKLLKEKHPEITGGMMAVGSTREDIQPMLDGLKGYATVACVNSPGSVTISGDMSALDELQVILEEKGMFNRKLKVDIAYHSKHLKLVAPEYLASISHIMPRSDTKATMHSSLLGRVVKPEEVHPDYWSDNLTHTVEFTSAVQSLASLDKKGKGVGYLVEIGPHSALKGPCGDILKTVGSHGSKIGYDSVLTRGTDACHAALTCAGKLAMNGVPINYEHINFPVLDGLMPTVLNSLPNYGWNHSTAYRHHWRIQDQHLYKTSPRHDLVGTTADWSNELEPTWRNIVRLDSLPWLRDHMMQGLIVFPLAGYVSMAMEAAKQRAEKRAVTFDKFEVREVSVARALVLEDGTDAEMNITLRPYNEGTRSWSDQWDEFRVTSWTQAQGWTEHCRGHIAVRNLKNENGVVEDRVSKADAAKLQALANRVKKASTTKVDSEKLYEELTARGVGYGPTFQGLEDVKASDQTSISTAILRDTASGMPKGHESSYLFHPTYLDMLSQASWPIFGAGRSRISTMYMPSSIDHMEISRDVPHVVGNGLQVICTGEPNFERAQPVSFDIAALTNEDYHNPLVTIRGLTLKPIDDGESAYATDVRPVCYKMDWINENDLNKPAEGEEAEPKEAEKEEEQVPVEADVVVVHADSQSDFATALSRLLGNATKGKVSTGTLAEVDPTDKICVVTAELVAPVLKEISKETFEQVQQLMGKAKGVLWLTSGAAGACPNPDTSMIVGLARSIRCETASNIAILDLDPADAKASNAVSVFERIWAHGKTDMEWMERNGEFFVPRITNDPERDVFLHRDIKNAAPYDQPFFQEGRRLKLVYEKPGSLDTLHFDDEVVGPLPDDHVEIKVEATGMNFKDIVVAMGQVVQPYLGIECSGTISSVGSKVTSVKLGDRVMALPHGAYANYARCAATSVTKLPDSLSFEVAASIPVVFCTAYHGLVNLAHLEEGEKVLIHSAAGGVGQAAIQIAQMLGAEIFATVGSQGKKASLMKRYGLPEDHIFYSRDTTFGPAVRSATKGHGVDVVLNSLAGDILRETWDCLADFGRFIEIGKRDITNNSRLEMAKFDNNATFASVDLSKIADKRPAVMSKLFATINGLFAKGTLKPIDPVTTVSITDVEQAFRTLQSGKNLGKLVVTAAPDALVKATCSKTTEQIFTGNASYLIIGGTGGLGQQMTRWMAKHGAKHIVLSSRSGKQTDELKQLSDEVKQMGTTVHIIACDVAKPEAVTKLINEDFKSLPPLRGVVHAPMVLRDILFEKMTHEDYEQVVDAKVNGAWNLHNTLGSTPLDFFLTISSTSAITGTRGQAAYAAANTFLDRFVQYRRSQGLPATTVNLTAVGNVGLLEDGTEFTNTVARTLALEFISGDEMLAIFHAAVTGKVDESISYQSISGLNIEPGTADNLPWTSDAKFTILVEESQGGADVASAQKTVSTSQLLKKATTHEECIDAIIAGLTKKLSDVLSIPEDEIDRSGTMEDYGLDSLVAIEIRNWISRETEANVQVLDLLRATSLEKLCEKILSKSKMFN